jgi:hypothetical protein
MYNSPFKNKNIDKMNGTGKATTANAMMNPGPGDPPKKKGTAYTVTSEDKLTRLTEGYESAKAAHMAAMGPDPEGKKKMRDYAEAIRRQPGGVQKWQDMTGAVMKKKGEVEGTYEDVTLSKYAADKGVTTPEAARHLQRQNIEVAKSRAKK